MHLSVFLYVCVWECVYIHLFSTIKLLLPAFSAAQTPNCYNTEILKNRTFDRFIFMKHFWLHFHGNSHGKPWLSLHPACSFFLWSVFLLLKMDNQLNPKFNTGQCYFHQVLYHYNIVHVYDRCFCLKYSCCIV